jgi:regulation of enolase protein 1 (concanavalin A-like superfamily)
MQHLRLSFVSVFLLVLGSVLSAVDVTSLNPTAGSYLGGKSVIITGTGFTGATAVTFGSLPVESGRFTVNSDTQITVSETPSNFAQVSTVAVSVTAPGGTGTKAAAYSFVAPLVPGAWPGTLPFQDSVYGHWVNARGALPMSATVSGSNLVFALANRGINGSACYYQVYRKLRDATAWGTIYATTTAGATTWTDAPTAGVAYEYKFVLKNHGLTTLASGNNAMGMSDPIGYLIAGIGVDMTQSRGRMAVVVADDVRTTYPSEYAGYLADLAADGWTVHEIRVARAADRTGAGNQHQAIRTSIKSIYTTYPGELKHVSLLGSVPVVRTGTVNMQVTPDGHNEGEVAHWSTAFDGYYGEMNEDSKWTDTGSWNPYSPDTVNNAGSRNVAGDGKFDPLFVGSRANDVAAIELGWGRIDFRKTNADLASYKTYFDRLAAYRRADATVYPGERSVMRYGTYSNVDESALNTIPALVGPANLLTKPRYDMAVDMPPQNDRGWFDNAFAAATGPYLFYFHGDGGPGYTGLNAIFGTGMQSNWGYWYLDGYESMQFCAAGKGANLSYTWSQSTNRFDYHRLGLGGDMGDVMRTTINKGYGGAKTSLYSWASEYFLNPVDNTGLMAFTHIGDPTLRLYPIKPPSGLTIASVGGAKLTWQASPDSGIVGYHVYKSTTATGPFTRITSSPVAATTYTDSATTSGTWTYMVKAVRLQTTGGGTYYNPSLGTSQTVNLSATPAALAVSTSTLSNAGWNTAYTTTLATTGGWSGATWSLVSGTLPTGLTLGSDGVISGSTALPGSYAFTVRATDGAGTTADKALTLLVTGNQTLTLAPVADSFVSGGTAASNFGRYGYLNVSQGYGNPDYPLLRFDLSIIPSNTIVSATLRLASVNLYWHNPVAGTTLSAYLGADVGDGWLEGEGTNNNNRDWVNGVDYASRPADRSGISPVSVTLDSASAAALTTPGGVLAMDVTSLVQADVTADAQRRLTLRLQSSSDLGINFGQREGAAASVPQLILVVQSPTPVLSYSPTTLAEAAANNGTINGTFGISLTNDTFVADVVSANRVTATNVPAGLTPVFTRVSSSQLTLGFSGAATSHANANDIGNLTITFANGAFVSNALASAVQGSTKNNLALNFNDASVTFATQVSPAGAGTVTPSGTTSAYQNDPTAISATVASGYSFVNWTATGATIANATALSTTATPTGNATVTANYALTPVLSLSGSADEGAENGASISVSLANAQFVASLTQGAWTVTGLPGGVTMGAVTRTGATTATISLSGNRTADYDANINPTVTVATSQLTGTSVPQTVSASIGFSLVALNDTARLFVQDDGQILVNAENGEVLTLSLEGATFASSFTGAHVSISNLPNGTSVGTLTRTSATAATVQLSGNSSATTSVTGVVVTIAASGLDAAAGSVSGNALRFERATSTIILQNGLNGYNGEYDTYISNSAKTANYGGFSSLSLNSSGPIKGLFYFDISSLSGSTITGATLSMYQLSGIASTLTAYPMTATWAEMSATYNSANGSIGGTSMGSVSAPATASLFVDIPLSTATVQGWINSPATSYGIAVTTNSTNSLTYASREWGTQGYNPKLTITLPSLATAEIQVDGCTGTEIVSGDATPSTTDGTDFGSVAVGSSRTLEFTLRNLGGTALNLTGGTRVAISGTNAADFTVVSQPAASIAIRSDTVVRIRYAPSTSGTRAATVTIANSDTNEGTYTFALQGTATGVATPTAPTITSSAPAGGTVGTAYSYTYTATGSATITYSVTSGALPTGLTLSSGGVISGTPSAAGTFTGVVTASNGTSPNATQSFSIVIASAAVAPAITSSAPVGGTVGTAYSHTYTATGSATITYSVTSGALPTGLTLSSGGVISGTPSVAGTFTGVVTAANGTAPNATQNFSIVIANPASGGILVRWNSFVGNSSSGNPNATETAGTLAVNLAASSATLSRGLGFNITGDQSYGWWASNNFGTQSGDMPANLAASRTLAIYASCTMTPNAGYATSISGVNCFAYNGGSTSTVEVLYSLDGFATYGSLGSRSTANTVLTFDASGVAALQQVTSPVAIRFYFYGETGGYQVRGLGGDPATATPALTVLGSVAVASAPNTAPTITTSKPASLTTLEDTAGTVSLTATDADADTLTWTIQAQGTKGTAAATGTGSPKTVTYTPTSNLNGSDSFVVQVSDGRGGSDTITVNVTITSVNDAPVATAQSVTVTEDVAKAITLAGTDIEGSALTYAVGTSPTKGVLSGTAPNLTYTPNSNATGVDSFTFTVNDGTAISTAATVTITITAVNDAPVLASAIADQTATVGVAFSFQVPVGTFTDVDNASLTWSSNEALTWLSFDAATRTLSGTPTAGDVAASMITLTASDGSLSASDSFVLTVNAASNTAPTITTTKPSSLTTNEDTAGSVNLAATDANGDTLTWLILTQGTKGTAAASGTGSPKMVTYTPTANLNGSDAFVVQVSDGRGGTDTITVNVTISAVNDVPVATAQSLTVTEDVAQAITLAGTDIEGSALTYAVGISPTKGVLSGIAPNLTYTPNANATGADSFTFTVNDGTATSTAATVSISITAVNDAPVLASAIADQTATVGVAFSFQVPVGTFTDVDNASLTWSSNEALTWLSFDAATRTFSGTPTAGDVAATTITVSAMDGSLSASDSFVLTVASNLPAGWMAGDIGSVAAAGSTTYAGGVYTISGSGADIAGNQDELRFASSTVTGDVMITARVDGLVAGNTWAMAGVMIRESLASGSRQASTTVTQGRGTQFRRRLATDGSSTLTNGPKGKAPYWVRLERTGNQFISSVSADGTNWTEIRRETFVMGATVQVGLAVCSRSDGQLATAQISNVVVVHAIPSPN